MGDHTLEAARLGDPGAFEQLSEQYRRELHVHCYRMLGSVEDAEDAVQETFLRAWAACRTFDPAAGPTLATWLGTIARNVAVDALRARAVRPRLAPDGDEASERVGPTSAIDTAVARMALLDALSEVSPKQRGVVLLAVVRDRPYADVAAALDIPVGTVKSRVHHALRGMRRTLDRTELAA
jgi:RNA polymerase sigma-70 factor, ECF subfamily